MGFRPSTPPHRKFESEPPLSSLRTLHNNGVNSIERNCEFPKRFNSEYESENDSNSQNTLEQNRVQTGGAPVGHPTQSTNEGMLRNIRYSNGNRSHSI